MFLGLGLLIFKSFKTFAGDLDRNTILSDKKFALYHELQK